MKSKSSYFIVKFKNIYLQKFISLLYWSIYVTDAPDRRLLLLNDIWQTFPDVTLYFRNETNGKLSQVFRRFHKQA